MRIYNVYAAGEKETIIVYPIGCWHHIACAMAMEYAQRQYNVDLLSNYIIHWFRIYCDSVNNSL